MKTKYFVRAFVCALALSVSGYAQHASTPLIQFHTDSLSGSRTQYFGIWGPCSNAAGSCPMPIARDGVVSGCVLRGSIALTGSMAETFELMVNGVPCGISILQDPKHQLNADIANSCSVHAGDLLLWRATKTNSPSIETANITCAFK